METAGKRLFSFGVIADSQYADKDSKQSSDTPENIVNYRNAVVQTETAVKEFLRRKSELSFALNLGDIIDGNEDEESTLRDLDAIIAPFDQLADEMTVHHAIGNHCLHAPVDVLKEKLRQQEFYFAIEVHAGWKLIVLNTNDLGIKAEGEAQKRETEEFLKAHPMESAPNMKRWNSGIASEQLAWLKEELRAAEECGERVIVACHHPVGAGSAKETHMAWNSHVLESLFVESRSVVLVLSGHYHAGGYRQIEDTHFLVVDAALEAPVDSTAYGLVHVSADRIEVEGKGTVPQRTLAVAPL